MSGVRISLTTVLRRRLGKSVREANARGLLKSAKWSSEQLIGLVESAEVEELVEFDEGGVDEQDDMDVAFSSSLSQSREADLVLVGQSLIVNGEFQRCWHLLRSTFMKGSAAAPPSSSPLGQFLVCYALFMTGEQLKTQQQLEQQGQEEYQAALAATGNSANGGMDHGGGGGHNGLNRPGKEKDAGASRINNPFLRDLHEELYVPYVEGRLRDAHLLYLLGVVEADLAKQGYTSAAVAAAAGRPPPVPPMQILLQSAAANPLNWSCWLEIARLCIGEQLAPPSYAALLSAAAGAGGGEDELHQQQQHLSPPASAGLAAHWFMYNHFLAHLYLEQQLGHEALPVVQALALVLPSSQFLLNLRALGMYCLRDYDAAESSFEAARTADPYCLDHIDTYSNILYVKEDRVQLSHLAHMLSKVGKHSPEVCCVVGNYYSLRGMHERAILSFQRALRLNPKFLSAWTLMGHEYVELRNTSSAVYCYRKAVDVSPFDYRAWYGLGQTYEMLHLYQNAVYYYRKATALKPHDARMWCAIGSCLFRLGERSKAIAAYERAVESGDREGIANNELARLYRESGQLAAAADCYLAILGDGTGGTAESRAEALLFLAKYHRDTGDLQRAEAFAQQLASVVGREGDEARGILREIRARQ